jgi:hypothetical protein
MQASLLRLILLSLLTTSCHSQSEVFQDVFGQSQGNQTDGGGTDESSTTTPSVNATVIDQTFTATPTSSPTTGTEAPSMAPIATASVAGVVSLKLVNTPSLLIGQGEIDFLNAITTFFRQNVQAGLDERSTLEMTQIGILRQFRASGRRSLISQHRDLQDIGPLFVDVQIAAQHSRSNGAGDLDLDALLSLLFTNFAEEFLLILQDQSDDSFFNTLEAIEVVVETVAPTTSPVQETTSPVLTGSNRSNDEVDFWSIGVIVGVAAAGAVAILLLVAIVCRLTSSKKDAPPHSRLPTQRASRDWDKTPAVSQEGGSKRTAGISVDDPRQPEQFVDYERRSLSLPLQEQPSDLESNGLYSYIKTASDSTVGGSIMQNSIYGADDMSYAYSLQPGLEPSVAPGYSLDHSVRQNDSMVPKEIPQISVSGSKGKPRVSDLDDSVLADRTMEEASHEVQLSSSDLRLTESDLALLPSNLRDSFEEKSHSNPTPPTTRVVMAPSGKLGIVIDTTIDGPVVHHVNNASALKGKIFPGDIIVAIDNIDTRAMSASAITGLMIKTAKQKRRLTVLGAKETLKKKVNGRPGSNKRS